jgi:hypothetical protein
VRDYNVFHSLHDTTDGLVELCSMFYVAAKHLSGEKYSSFATALPLLKKIKRHLCDESLFDFSSTCCLDSNFKKLFQDLYGSCIFSDILQKVEFCRVLLSAEFNKRFIALDASILWTTLLDPRFNLKGWHWKDNNEASKSKKFLIQEVLALALSEERVHIDLASSSDDCNSDASFDALFDDRNVKRSSIDSQDKELTRIEMTLSMKSLHVSIIWKECL